MQIRSTVVQTIVNIVQTEGINSFFSCFFLFHFEKQIAATRGVSIHSDDFELKGHFFWQQKGVQI